LYRYVNEDKSAEKLIEGKDLVVEYLPVQMAENIIVLNRSLPILMLIFVKHYHMIDKKNLLRRMISTLSLYLLAKMVFKRPF
jgi:hypothetical protein